MPFQSGSLVGASTAQASALPPFAPGLSGSEIGHFEADGDVGRQRSDEIGERQLRGKGQEDVETVVQEDADAIGLSILSGGHVSLVSDVLQGMRAAGIADDLR